jgi:hypothetical protein
VAGLFKGGAVPFENRPTLNLDRELRFHFAGDLHRYVARLLDGAAPADLAPIAQKLDVGGYHLRITRSLDVAKRYLAVVAGRPREDQGELHLPLAADPDRPPRQRVDLVLGKRAATRWRFVAATTDQIDALSLLAVEPRPGRSHQIRVHLAWLGCPIVGDRLYGAAGRTNAGSPAEPSLGLHAAALALPHPSTGERLAFTASPPDAPPWEDFTPAIATAWAAWPSGSPSARSGRTGPDR